MVQWFGLFGVAALVSYAGTFQDVMHMVTTAAVVLLSIASLVLIMVGGYQKKKGTKEVIGRIDLGGFEKKSQAEISYFLSPIYWGQGMATEAVRRVTDFGIQELRLHRIEAKVRPENIGSCRVLRKLGYVEERLLRKCLFGKEFHDAYMFAMVEEKNLYKD